MRVGHTTESDSMGNSRGNACMRFLRNTLRDSGKNSIVYLLTVLAVTILGLRLYEPTTHSRLNPFAKRVLRIRYRIAYDYWFNRRNLKEAYSYRIKYMLAIYYGLFSGDIREAGNYLSVVAEPDFLNLLNLQSENINNINQLLWADSQFIKALPERKKVNNVLMCGPSSDLYSIDYSYYDFIVFNKPPPADLKIDYQKIILILNNQWVLNNRDLLECWLNENNPSFVFSPQPISFEGVLNLHAILPKFPLSASLMGLQRSLLILNHVFEITNMRVEGFNFSLTSEPYKEWYPSLIKQQFGELKKGIYDSNKIHDFALNLIFTRKLIRSSRTVFEGDFVDIAVNDIGLNINLFENLYPN
jgi:hypothetical protein